MTKLYEVLDMDLFSEQREAGNIRVQVHPEFDSLFIANYTEQAAFNRDWNDATRMCRGLIWNTDTKEVLARPFPKFHNFDEKEAPRILDDQVVWHWQDKADGSLGIMYERPDEEMAIATRGSFASEQAKLGTDLLQQIPHDEYMEYAQMAASGYTPLFEICGPDNRIVLKYDENHLVPLGYIHTETGAYTPARGTAAPRTMRDLLGDLSRESAEGWVVWLSNTKPVKIKQSDYVELHRLFSNLTEKEVWRQLRAGTYSIYVKELPDELFDMAEEWADGLYNEFIRHFRVATVLHEQVRNLQSAGLEAYSRKEQALWIQKYVKPEYRGLVFSLLDGRDISDAIWRMLEPKGSS